jgi:hypothetical protein
VFSVARCAHSLLVNTGKLRKITSTQTTLKEAIVEPSVWHLILHNARRSE